MTTHTIELDGIYTIAKGPRDKSWIAAVDAKLADIPASIVRDIFLHGLKQKVADAASSAKSVDEATGPMQKALDAILRGEWSSRGTGVDGTRTMAIVRLFKAMLDREQIARFNKLSGEDQVANAEANVTDESAIAAEVVVIEEARERARIEAETRKATVVELAKSIKVNF